MRRKIIIALLAILAVMIGWLLLPGLFSNEPKYLGKTARGWLKQYYRSGWQAKTPDANANRREEAMDSLRVLGTNAVPYLVTEYFSTRIDSSLRTNLHALLTHLPRSLRPAPYVGADIIRTEALMAIYEMRPPAEQLLSLVTNHLYGTDSAERTTTVRLLCALKAGTNQVMPILREMLRGTNVNDRQMAASFLVDLEEAAAPAVPDLVELINNNPNDRSATFLACRVLGKFGEAGSNAVPALRARLAKCGKSTSGFETAATLVQIDASQTEALNFLRDAAMDPNERSREFAANCLGTIGKNAKAAAPQLYELAISDTPYIWSSAATALLNIGETNLAMTAAYRRLNFPFKNYQLTATYLLTRCEPNNMTAVTKLTELAWDNNYGQTAIEQLGRLRPMPDVARLTLQQISTNQSHAFRLHAAKALQTLEREKSNPPSLP